MGCFSISHIVRNGHQNNPNGDQKINVGNEIGENEQRHPNGKRDNNALPGSINEETQADCAEQHTPD